MQGSFWLHNQELGLETRQDTWHWQVLGPTHWPMGEGVGVGVGDGGVGYEGGLGLGFGIGSGVGSGVGFMGEGGPFAGTAVKFMVILQPTTRRVMPW